MLVSMILISMHIMFFIYLYVNLPECLHWYKFEIWGLCMLLLTTARIFLLCSMYSVSNIKNVYMPGRSNQAFFFFLHLFSSIFSHFFTFLYCCFAYSEHTHVIYILHVNVYISLYIFITIFVYILFVMEDIGIFKLLFI